jgi:hypothetical protein
MVEQANQPRQFVRDQQGNIAAIKQGNKVQNVVRDDQGNMVSVQ